MNRLTETVLLRTHMYVLVEKIRKFIFNYTLLCSGLFKDNKGASSSLGFRLLVYSNVNFFNVLQKNYCLMQTSIVMYNSICSVS